MYQEMQPEHKHVSVKLVFLVSLVVFILAVVIYFVLTNSDRNSGINQETDKQMSIWLAETSPSESRPDISPGELEAYLEETSPTEKIAGDADVEAFLEETSVESN